MQLPDHSYSLLVLPVKEGAKAYDHGRYAVEQLALWHNQVHGQPLHLMVKGMGYQCVMPLHSSVELAVEDHYAEGTLNGKVRKYLDKVILRRK
jgi:hypothetical protein